VGPLQGLGAIRLGESDGAALMAEQDERDEVVVPVIEEELSTGTRQVTTGAVRVEKRVEKRVRRVTAPALHEEVEIRRVPINRVVTEAPKSRRQGNTVIVPVVEEELVVTKRLVLKEEIHLIKKRMKDRVVKEVELGRERATVRRVKP
jgi:uncharacterized protein (TIGR02271 family)